MDCRAALFDIDGTLVNSLPLYKAALNSLLETDGHRTLDSASVVGLFQDNIEYILRQAFATTGEALSDAAYPQALTRFLAFYEGRAAEYAELYPGVAQTLETLSQSGIQLAIATNRPHSAAVRILDDFGLLPYFPTIFSVDNATKRKPDPAHLLETVESMAVAPREAIMVGDHEMDVAAAQDAGMPMVLVSYGYAKALPKTLNADRLIDHFTDLPDAIRSLP